MNNTLIIDFRQKQLMFVINCNNIVLNIKLNVSLKKEAVKVIDFRVPLYKTTD